MILRNLKPADIGLFAFAFSITSFPAVASIGLALFIIGNAIERWKFKPGFNKNFILPFGIIFLINIIGFFYAPDKKYAFELLGKLLAIIVIPIAFGLRNTINVETTNLAKRIFINGLVFWCAFSILKAFIDYFDNGETYLFTYFGLAEILHLHPTYESFYILVAFLFLPVLPQKWGRILTFIFLLSYIALLQSRMAYILTAGIFFYWIMVLSRKNKNVLWLFLVPLSAIAVLIFSPISQRMSELDVIGYTHEDVGTTQENGVNQRIWLWKNGYEQIKERPFFGYGLGSQKNYFRWEVEKNLLFSSYDWQRTQSAKDLSQYNLHNQYLQYLYEFGIFGLLLFGFALYKLVRYCVNRREYIGLIILFLFSVFMLTENMLDRQMGIYSFTFMMCLLLYSRK